MGKKVDHPFAVGDLPWADGEPPIRPSFAGFIPIRNQSHQSGKKVDNRGGSIFFWYFPAQEPLVPNPPLIVWLQGGPGSSSMFGFL